MIEIRELVIRANVDNSGRGNREERPSAEGAGREREGCCAENVDMLLRIIKEKKER